MTVQHKGDTTHIVFALPLHKTQKKFVEKEKKKHSCKMAEWGNYCRASPVKRQQHEMTKHEHTHRTDNAGRAGHWQSQP